MVRKILAATTAFAAGVVMLFATAEQPAEAAPCALINIELVVIPLLPPIPICI